MVAVIVLVRIPQQAFTAAVLLDLLFNLMGKLAKVGFRILGTETAVLLFASGFYRES